MFKKLLIIFLFFFGCLASLAQTISGKIFDNISSKPIVDVAIITDKNIGTTSNDFGEYTLDLKDAKTINFSSLGYKNITLKVEELQQLNFIIYLEEEIDELDEIQLNLAKITLDSLLLKSTKSMQENYIETAIKQDFYQIENQGMEFQKLEVEIGSSSLFSKNSRKLAEKELQLFTDNLMANNPEFINEFSGIISSKKTTSEKNDETFSISQINTVAGFKQNVIGNGLNLKNVQTKLQEIVLKHLNNNKTYKIKTGLFTVKDSLSFKKIKQEADSLLKDTTYSETFLTNIKSDADKIGLFINKIDENNFFDTNYYEHKIEENEILGNRKYYVVSFHPKKSKSKFAGKVYINPTDFTMKKIQYQYAKGKRGDHVNLKLLLGVKYSENENKATIYFEKNNAGKVYTSYYKNFNKNYAYVNRPLKFIENSKEKEKLKFNIKLEIIVSLNTEILLENSRNALKENITGFKKEDLNKKHQYISTENYEASQWKNRQLVEQYLKQYQ